MQEEYAKELIEKNRKAYDFISKDFDRTRAYLWDGLKPFAKYTNDNQSILDFGCGNGRLISLFSKRNISYTGVDLSEALINIAKKKYKDNLSDGVLSAEFLKIDSLELHFSDCYFDNIYSIAVLHHIPTENMRIKLLKEFYRTLKPKGKIILTNWNLWQPDYRNLIFKYAIKKLLGQSKLSFNDIMVPWKNEKKEVVAERYYHAFTMRELESILKKSRFKLLENGYFGGKNNDANIYIVAEK
ncbi:MAG: class I SAM-dependent methyltransferase [Patescibacteria group bacterium]